MRIQFAFMVKNNDKNLRQFVLSQDYLAFGCHINIQGNCIYIYILVICSTYSEQKKKCNRLYQSKYAYVSVFILQDLFIARSNWKQIDHWPKGIMSKCKTYSRIWPMIMKFAKLLTSVFSCSIRNIEIHPFYGRYIYNYKYYWVKMHYTLFQFSTLLHC